MSTRIKKDVINFYLDAKDKLKIEKYCMKENITVSTLMRGLIDKFLVSIKKVKSDD